MLRMTNFVLILLILLGGIAGGTWYFARKYKQKAKEMESAYRLEIQKTEVYKDKSNQWRARANAATLSNNTLKKLARVEGSHYNDLRKEFDDLKKNLKNLENNHSIETKTIIEVETILHDTVYITKDGTQVAAKSFVWIDSSGYNNFVGTVSQDSIMGKLEVIDSLEIVTLWKRKVPIIGKKQYETNIISRNPSTKIVNVKSVVKKKKK